MTDITTTPVDAIDVMDIEAELRPMSTEKLKETFFECHQGARNFIARAAVSLKLLRERGENLDGLPMVGTFRRIADGQVLADLVWKYIESPNRSLVERLPLEDQKKLVKNSVVIMAEPKPGGGFTKRNVDLVTAPKEVAKVVVGDGGLRSYEEQMIHLAALKARPAINRPVEKEDEIQEPLAHSITIKLTESEWKAIRLYAAQNGCTEREAARMFMIRSTLFKQVKA